jgi:hypothetical protein
MRSSEMIGRRPIVGLSDAPITAIDVGLNARRAASPIAPSWDWSAEGYYTPGFTTLDRATAASWPTRIDDLGYRLHKLDNPLSRQPFGTDRYTLTPQEIPLLSTFSIDQTRNEIRENRSISGRLVTV